MNLNSKIIKQSHHPVIGDQTREEQGSKQAYIEPYARLVLLHKFFIVDQHYNSENYQWQDKNIKNLGYDLHLDWIGTKNGNDQGE